MKKTFHFTLMMAGIVLSMLAITACHKNEIEGKIDWDRPADHTLLMYLVGDNSLSTLLESNVRDAQSAIRDSVFAGTLNLVVMKDNGRSGDSYPTLYWVHANERMQLDTIKLRQWDEDKNTASPDFLAEILSLTFTRFNTPIKGLSLGSHASGWVPLNNYNDYSAQSRAFGQDSDPTYDATMELWDLADALRKGPKLNYILMDCCHMATAEVAYELRDVADYMVACPTEEEGAGLPYKQIVPALSRCKSANDLPQALDYCARCYYHANARYSYGATISLIDLRRMDQVASTYRQVLISNADLLKQLSEAKGYAIDEFVTQLQRYGRNEQGLHNYYYYYDIVSLIDALADADPQAAAKARQAVTDAVPHHYATPSYRGIDITQSSGMAVSLPEVLHLAHHSNGYHLKFSPFNDVKLLTGYHLTAWGAYMGY